MLIYSQFIKLCGNVNSLPALQSMSTQLVANGLSEMCNKCAGSHGLSVCAGVCVYAITFCVHLNVINRFMACFIAFSQRLAEISLISHFSDF